MIPDDSAAGAMDSTRDPDVCMDDSLKKTGCQDSTKKTEEDQDINDNHTKLAAQGQAASGESSEALANGETVQTQDNNTNSEKNDNGEEESSSNGDKKDNHVEGSDKMETDETDGLVNVDGLGGSDDEDDGKISSEDDEDKLVISEGNERGTEESADENSKGEHKTSSSRSSTPQRSEKRPAEDELLPEAKKRPRPLEDLVNLDGLTSVSQVDGSLGQVKKDLEAIEFLLKQKEEEWNTLVRLQKRREELYLRLVRKRQVLVMKGGHEEDSEGKDEDGEAAGNLMFLPQGGYSSLGGPQLPLMMMSQLLSGSVSPQSLQIPPQVVTKDGKGGNNGNISVIDIHTSSNKPGGEVPRISMTSDAHTKLSKQLTASMKPILPKPSGPHGSLASLQGALSSTPTGVGPQGPTINVQQLIAAHRKENPNTPPISVKPATSRRATRGAWRHRYDGDKRSSRDHERPPSVSSSSSEADMRSAKGMLAMSDPSVSYKDVLLRFAELTQIEKQPGSPQISIFPVGSSESSTRKSEGSRESTPAARDQTPTSLPSSLPTSKPSLEGPSALAKLLLGSQSGVSGGGVKMMGDAATNPQYLTLSALLSGGSTTTVKDKNVTLPQQPESRPKKTQGGGEEGGGTGNPKCQGCHKQRAQFVCAGCGNQWYCSRECQVAAWEEHSEHCSN